MPVCPWLCKITSPITWQLNCTDLPELWKSQWRLQLDIRDTRMHKCRKCSYTSLNSRPTARQCIQRGHSRGLSHQVYIEQEKARDKYGGYNLLGLPKYHSWFSFFLCKVLNWQSPQSQTIVISINHNNSDNNNHNNQLHHILNQKTYNNHKFTVTSNNHIINNNNQA